MTKPGTQDPLVADGPAGITATWPRAWLAQRRRPLDRPGARAGVDPQRRPDDLQERLIALKASQSQHQRTHVDCVTGAMLIGHWPEAAMVMFPLHAGRDDRSGNRSIGPATRFAACWNSRPTLRPYARAMEAG